jgi:hypothetical protein
MKQIKIIKSQSKKPKENEKTISLSKFNNKYDKFRKNEINNDNLKIFNSIKNIKQKPGKMDKKAINQKHHVPLKSNKNFYIKEKNNYIMNENMVK